ncbi:4'-phosphopantetheinyl transferase [Enterococcus dispar]|uniref:4'-phosphopantetheinyl transferase n=1 Tax=Enterococcus dispar TaxID=44009 RepID=UPI002492F359|nr:4'-phosphopantetheinyl transferase [Enterococcus dispar]
MVEEAITILKQQTGIITKAEDWGEESVTLGNDEVDPDTIPVGIELPPFVLATMYLYMADEQDYVVYFLSESTSQHSIAKGLLVDGKLVWSVV